MKILLLITFLSIGAFSIAAQAPKPENCPLIEVFGPSTLSSPGDTIGFRASIKYYANSEKLSYKWTVSLGEIIEGKDTFSIKVKKPENGGGKLVTATVEIIGLPAGCENTASESEAVADRK